MTPARQRGVRVLVSPCPPHLSQPGTGVSPTPGSQGDPVVVVLGLPPSLKPLVVPSTSPRVPFPPGICGGPAGPDPAVALLLQVRDPARAHPSLQPCSLSQTRAPRLLENDTNPFLSLLERPAGPGRVRRRGRVAGRQEGRAAPLPSPALPRHPQNVLVEAVGHKGNQPWVVQDEAVPHGGEHPVLTPKKGDSSPRKSQVPAWKTQPGELFSQPQPEKAQIWPLPGQCPSP